MCRFPGAASRRGVTVVECAVVFPVTFMILLGLVVGGMGIFRYQEAAWLARMAARYASTHGNQWRTDALASGQYGPLTFQVPGSPGTSAGTYTDNGTTPPTTYLAYQADPMSASGTDTSWTGDIYDSAIRPNLVSLKPQYLSVQVAWPPVINQPNNPDNWQGSKVQVTITYQWLPEVFFIGPINLTSTSTMPITN